MKNLIIVGAGGLGRTIFDWARESICVRGSYQIKGFIDDNLKSLDKFQGYPPIISTITEYLPTKDDVLVCAIGGAAKLSICKKLLSKHVEFVNVIHNTVRIGSNAKLGKGNVLGPNVSLGPDSEIGDFNLIQNDVIISHDVKLGDFNRLDTRVLCVGGIQIGNRVTIHSSAVLNHKVKVEDDAIVGACSFVIRSVKSGTTVFGAPATKIC